MLQENWFACWFDTPYYHILYQNRNFDEAKGFMDRLVAFLHLPEKAKILDLACGKGRHAAHLATKNFDVTGVDLSPNSISEAKIMECPNLKFMVHDMRERLTFDNCEAGDNFDAVFNLFTSFGYFDDTSENLKVTDAVFSMLKENGIFVIDFMNVSKVLHNLVEHEIKTLNEIDFKINRSFDGKHIHKKIEFMDGGENFEFAERVQALNLEDFKSLLNHSGFKILHSFGSYDLELFDLENSNRLIIIAQKTA